MLEITEIKYTDCIEITLSSGETLKLPFNAGIKGLEKGSPVDDAELDRIRGESARFTCRTKAVGYLSGKARTFREMEKFLLNKRFDADTVSETMSYLAGEGYINDYEYSMKYIRHGRKKTAGDALIKKQLFGKGVPLEIINRAVNDSMDGEIDADEVYRLAMKKYSSTAGKTNRISKVIFFLKQRGFGSGTIRTVIDRLKAESGQDLHEEDS
jgi:regulatory protein